MTDRLTATRLRTVRLAAVLAGSLALLAPATASASIARAPLIDGGVASAPGPGTIQLTKIADVPQPVLAIGAGDNTDRLYIVGKGGKIRVYKNGGLLPTPFLDITTQVSKGTEQGLLGLAFHPAFATNHKLYVYFTNTAGDTVVREYRTASADSDVVQAGTGRTILTIDQPYVNHNGGMLAFGRDGFLYIGLGDGGSAGDPGNRAQSIQTLLGKILRININGETSTKRYLSPKTNPYYGKDGRDEIWMRGLRNPWRYSFDRQTGDLWIGDVGQEKYEEVDRAPLTDTGPGKGLNFGWRVMEGRHCYLPSTGCSQTGKKLPLTEYQHQSGRCAVTGGYVYRGLAIPELTGYFLYGDYCSGEVWAVSSTASAPTNGVQLIGLGSGRLVSGFGQDDDGELYLCDLNGAVYRIDSGI